MSEGEVGRDVQRAKVYAAERFVRTLFDRAAERGSADIDFFGTRLTLPPEARFGSVAAVGRYVDDVLALEPVRRRWPEATAPTVRVRRGVTAAHYEKVGETGVIAVPEQGHGSWALRELVVLHEMAHHLCDVRPAHGPEFTATLCALAEIVMGPELGYVLRVVFASEGVR
ncbi:TIGR04338 family metallohydrolase [[Mycobacterium] vasticus]|uniref:TIGR04338 family metallohydrolase n=1 Tax=[Mycobacterium] vasticus TaxID=2875777 RepID=A0ABU5Z5H8_9MYCO|nr:TIGR04338 family metallohydrolase [Mycolicibacter sp. MYC017]MEB3071203.1 TIGR04338 family metallohydrolase [Mycolicibacter sp. MYC017]